jgi:hypothetical protein
MSFSVKDLLVYSEVVVIRSKAASEYLTPEGLALIPILEAQVLQRSVREQAPVAQAN